MANIITSRDKGKGEMTAGRRKMCDKPGCSERGEFFGFYRGTRMWFCQKCFREWSDAAARDITILEE